jgi:hypothetical protein
MGKWGLCIVFLFFFFESFTQLKGIRGFIGNGVIKEGNYIEFFAFLLVFSCLSLSCFFYLRFFHRYYILSLLAGFEEEFVDLVRFFIMAPMVDIRDG